jgi:SAM-dependent methyltransferase
MEGRAGAPAQTGEYDEAMQALLQHVWGDGFLSPGGADEIARLLEGVDLRGCQVLDIGSGLGAIDVLLVTRHGAAQVSGVDLDADLVAKAQARIAAAGLGERIHTRVVLPGPLDCADQSVDVVFSKDSIVQIPDKEDLFAECHRVLKRGGCLVASDWLRGGAGAYSAQMHEYFRLEGITYNMASPEATRAALAAAGFIDIELRDRSAWYVDLARREHAALSGAWRETLSARIGEARTVHFIANWRQLVIVLERGELLPTHLLARRAP